MVANTSLLTVFKSLILFGNFLLKKQDFLAHSSSLANIGNGYTAWRSAITSLSAATANAAATENCAHMVLTNMPHLLWNQTQSPPIILTLAGGLRKCTARSYYTLCICTVQYTLSTVLAVWKFYPFYCT